MIRLLTGVLLLAYSLFGWASADSDDYDNMVIHKESRGPREMMLLLWSMVGPVLRINQTDHFCRTRARPIQ